MLIIFPYNFPKEYYRPVCFSFSYILQEIFKIVACYSEFVLVLFAQFYLSVPEILVRFLEDFLNFRKLNCFKCGNSFWCFGKHFNGSFVVENADWYLICSPPQYQRKFWNEQNTKQSESKVSIPKKRNSYPLIIRTQNKNIRSLFIMKVNSSILNWSIYSFTYL